MKVEPFPPSTAALRDQDTDISEALTEQELADAKEALRRYFDIGWQIALRLHREGRLEAVLTEAGLNPMVNPPRTDAASNHSTPTD